MISISAGKISASVEALTAPINEIIGPKFGTATAKITVNNQIMIYKSNIRFVADIFTCEYDQSNP